MSHTQPEFTERAACRGMGDVMCPAALDYSPDDDSYDHLTEAEHAEHATAKVAAESVAVNVCMGCPALFECEKWVMGAGPISGVVAGRTIEERNALTLASGQEIVTEVDIIAPTYRDRGSRLQVGDDAVVLLTSLGRNSKSIARELGCAERTVVRARARAASRVVATDSVPDETVIDLDVDVAAEENVVTLDIPRARSAAMQAVYVMLSDGKWHTRDALLSVGVQHVGSDEALAWWVSQNSEKNADGVKVLSSAKVSTPTSERIRAGARDKTNNALAASTRNRGNTERGGPHGTDTDLYRLAVHAVAPCGALVTAGS